MITGTFLDEISHDIPSANWGRDEWAHDFAQMRADGIDTVILIRAGYKDRATFDSKTLRSLHSCATTCGSWRSAAALVMCSTNLGAMSTP